jgi:hypothetical protein
MGGRSGMKTKRKVSGQNWEFDGSTITVSLPDGLEAPRRPQADHRAGPR